MTNENFTNRLTEQPHIERMFRVLFMLQSVKRYKTREIAESIGTTVRTVQRYVEDFRNAGFEIVVDKNCYRLKTDSRWNQKIIDLMRETSEWRIFNNIEEFSTAINLGKSVRLIGYASGHSDTVKDREVEPFEMTKNKRYVWCYDPQDGYCKVFRPSRCRKVKTLDKNWKSRSRFESENIDIFGFHGEKAIRVQLILDIMAHNLLLEENNEAELEMTRLDDNKWLLNTRVYEIQGVGRFCMGLIGHIEIIESPELEEYMRGKCSEFLSDTPTER